MMHSRAAIVVLAAVVVVSVANAVKAVAVKAVAKVVVSAANVAKAVVASAAIVVKAAAARVVMTQRPRAVVSVTHKRRKSDNKPRPCRGFFYGRHSARSPCRAPFFLAARLSDDKN
ncbi:hypothetical protein ESA_03553 [Cronobacter sakazakii ATCC BAA-894]|uniref:Uncharacterized protein n=1 Tax=Cronobacter sakazakii (strain ATCC BAA-894) TaxID=290339 RepID=A7MIN1_CROS8|nr:hypothetical protein ESA_03553 [Cronobacter sakazakii ATCC BAA-894]